MNQWVLNNTNKGTNKATTVGNTTVFQYPCDSNNDCTFYNAVLSPGLYKLEVWGAQGGGSYHDGAWCPSRGKGGYSVGAMSLYKETYVAVFIGGRCQDGVNPTISVALGGYNGGGSCIMYSGDGSDDTGGGGGGASDIRINGIDPKNRIIVAGGAGGNGFDTGYFNLQPYPYGGGLVASPPVGKNVQGTPASQTTGYSSSGQGQTATSYSEMMFAGGGGGGFFGGFTIKGSCGGQGGGGSGYIGGVTSFGDITALSKPGNENMPLIDGNGVGNSDHGKARITLLFSLPVLNKQRISCMQIYFCRSNIFQVFIFTLFLS